MGIRHLITEIGLIVVMMLPLHAGSMEEDTSDEILEWLDEMTETYAVLHDEGDEEGLEQYYQTMLAAAHALLEHPVDLNRATSRELEQIVWLTPFQIKSLLHHRAEHGAILSAYELPYIAGFDTETARWLQHFVTFGASVRAGPKQKIQGDATATWQQKLPLSKGYTVPDSANRYPGTPWALAVRTGFRLSPHWELHFGADKDAGEPAFNTVQRGFDSYNGSLRYHGEGLLKQVVIGQFKISSGEGLVAGNRFFSSLSGMATSVRNSSNCIRAGTSTGESGFLNGGSIMLGGKHWTWSGWAARNTLDANLAMKDSVRGTFSTIYSTGLHRTETERMRRGVLHERNTGLLLEWQQGAVTIGATWVDYAFNHPWIPNDQPYKRFAFSGTHGNNIGMHIRFFWNQLIGFGECARSENGAWAFIGGTQWLWPDNASVTLLYRNLDKDYHTRLGSGSGVSSAVSNERGWFLGFQIPLKGRWRVAGCVDLKEAPWLKYGVDAPSADIRCLSRLTCQPSRTSSISMQWSWKSQEANRTGSGVSERITTITRQDVKSSVQFCPFPRLTLKTQMGWKQYRKERTKSQGCMIAQSISLRTFKERMELYAQAAWFSTDNYQSALYLSEKGMLYGFSSSMLYQRGWHTALLCKFTPGHRWTLRCKYGWTGYQDIGSMGSGLDLLDGHTKREWKFQLIKKW